MLEALKDIYFIYQPIHHLHRAIVKHDIKKRYLAADNVKLTVNNKGSKKKYLLFRYFGSQGLMAQVMGVLTWVNYAIKHNYTLVVDMTEGENIYRESEHENVWEKYYHQPMLEGSASYEWIQHTLKNENYAIAPLVDRASLLWIEDYTHLGTEYPPTIVHPSTRDYKTDVGVQRLFEWLYARYIRPTGTAQEYMDREYETVLADATKDGLVGVVVRGTDYTACSPYMHPVQPKLATVVEEVAGLLGQYANIYLATDESDVQSAFQREFPGRVLTNRRHYYESPDYGSVSLMDMHTDRKRDRFLRGLEYMSSMNLLSKCDALVGGLCGGSQAAMLMNQGRYQEVKLFDLGNYGLHY